MREINLWGEKTKKTKNYGIPSSVSTNSSTSSISCSLLSRVCFVASSCVFFSSCSASWCAFALRCASSLLSRVFSDWFTHTHTQRTCACEHEGDARQHACECVHMNTYVCTYTHICYWCIRISLICVYIYIQISCKRERMWEREKHKCVRMHTDVIDTYICHWCIHAVTIWYIHPATTMIFLCMNNTCMHMYTLQWDLYVSMIHVCICIHFNERCMYLYTHRDVYMEQPIWWIQQATTYKYTHHSCTHVATHIIDTSSNAYVASTTSRVSVYICIHTSFMYTCSDSYNKYIQQRIHRKNDVHIYVHTHTWRSACYVGVAGCIYYMSHYMCTWMMCVYICTHSCTHILI